MKKYILSLLSICLVFSACAEAPAKAETSSKAVDAAKAVVAAKVTEPKKKTVCLNMIVKNESQVITRCLKSVKPFIDYWAILDTGSTDGTQQVIKDFMKDVPGELHEDPFRNFEYSRNKSLDYAHGKADYILFIDADEQLLYDKDYKLPPLEKDFYYINTIHSGTEYVRIQLIKDSLNWRWRGVLHEAVCCDEAKTHETLTGIKNLYGFDGARAKDPKKYQKDAAVFEEALKEDPNNSRYRFYLAQSYRDAGDNEKALENYQKRAEMGGWDQEMFWTKLQIAKLQKRLKMPPETFIASFYDAYHYRPTRIEPLYEIANYYRENGNYAGAYLVADIASKTPDSSDILFVEKWIWEHGIPLEKSIAAYWVGKYDECQSVSLKMLSNPKLPAHIKECVERNLIFTNQKLMQQFQNSLELEKLKEKAA